MTCVLLLEQVTHAETVQVNTGHIGRQTCSSGRGGRPCSNIAIARIESDTKGVLDRGRRRDSKEKGSQREWRDEKFCDLQRRNGAIVQDWAEHLPVDRCERVNAMLQLGSLIGKFTARRKN